jgi:gluconolactonase
MANGMALDRHGCLLICEQGTRFEPGRISRLDAHTGIVEGLVEQWSGLRLNSPNGVVEKSDGTICFTDPSYGFLQGFKDAPQVGALNSPNDLVYRSEGMLFFTDPPFGLPAMFDDPRKELPFGGVFRVKDGSVELVTDELQGPNGIALSPDERYLYVGNWDPKRKVVMRYDLDASGAVCNSRVLFDMTDAPGEDAIDGLKVDQMGNLYVCGPGGIWVLSADGRHLGTFRLPDSAHNLTWGDTDGRTLYVTALTSIYRLRLASPGVRPS